MEQLMSAIAHGLVILAYLCGSISSAILVCRLAGLPTLATAAPAIQGRLTSCGVAAGAAVAVLIFDVLKGMLPVWERGR